MRKLNVLGKKNTLEREKTVNLWKDLLGYRVNFNRLDLQSIQKYWNNSAIKIFT